jgi:lysophospholipase L1-like esterase
MCLLVALFAFAGEASVRHMEDPSAASPSGADRSLLITLVGNSITAGVINDPGIPGNLTGRQRLCWEGLCYAALVDAAMKQLDRSISTVNVGVGGATSRDWDPNDYHENDFHYTLNGNSFFGRRPLFHVIPASNIVVVYVGTVDSLGLFEYGGPTSTEEFTAHLHDIAATLLIRGVERVVLITPPVPAAWEASTAGLRMREYAEAARRVCAVLPLRYDECLLDLQRDFPVDGWAGQHIHPNLAGHRFIAERIVERIERLIVRLDRKGRARPKPPHRDRPR